MGDYDRKYFDSDVRADDSLLDLAIDYAWGYHGDFEFMVAARELVRATDTLPVGTARAVLNCMRVDPSVRNLPSPSRLASVSRMPRTPLRVRNVQPPAPERPPRPNWLIIPIRVKAEYGISAHRGYKLHRIASVECRIDAHKGYHGRRYNHHRFPWAHFNVQWMCGSPHAYTEWPILVLDPPADGDYCRACQEADL